MAVVGAPEDSFKTNWAVQLAIALAIGIPCYSYSCKKAIVLYLVMEGGEDYLLERFEEKIAAMGVNREVVLDRIYIKDFSLKPMDDSAIAEDLKIALCAMEPTPDVVILDPITYALNEDVRFSPQKAELCRNLIEIANLINGVTIPIIHCRKSTKNNDSMDDFLGSSIIADAAATRIKLFREGNLLTVYAKTRYAERPDSVNLNWKHPLLHVAPTALNPREEAKKVVVDLLKGNPSQESRLGDLITKGTEITKHNPKTVRAAIDNLAFEGKVKVYNLPKSAIKMVKLIPEAPIAQETLYAS
jgi:hypothetical protein